MRIYDICLADRGEIQKGSTEIFFRKVKFWKEDGQEEAPPVFVGIILLKNVIYQKQNLTEECQAICFLRCRTADLYEVKDSHNYFT